MRLELLCPACGVHDFDFDDHKNLVLLAPNLALVQFVCPRCGIRLSVTLKLTPEMQGEVRQRLAAASDDVASCRDASPPRTAFDPAALSYASDLVIEYEDVGVAMTRSLRLGNAATKAHLEYFRRQLELISTVDEAIEEIDAGYYREKRDV
jgi:hypothetical protein